MGDSFTGQKTQPTVSKYWRKKINTNTQKNTIKHAYKPENPLLLTRGWLPTEGRPCRVRVAKPERRWGCRRGEREINVILRNLEYGSVISLCGCPNVCISQCLLSIISLIQPLCGLVATQISVSLINSHVVRVTNNKQVSNKSVVIVFLKSVIS